LVYLYYFDAKIITKWKYKQNLKGQNDTKTSNFIIILIHAQ